MRAVSSRWLIIAALCFVGVGIGIYKARRFANAAPRQRTTTTQGVFRKHYIFHALRLNYFSCYYSFDVDGKPYRGNADCPQPGADGTVYYDPADPRLNSLVEFNTASEREYQNSTPGAVVGAFTVLACVFFGMLGASEKPAKDGASVDAGGIATYPAQAESAHSPGLRDLYLEVVNQIHPDRALNESDRALRERLMKQANAAFKRGDAGALRELLDEYRNTTSCEA